MSEKQLLRSDLNTIFDKLNNVLLQIEEEPISVHGKIDDQMNQVSKLDSEKSHDSNEKEVKKTNVELADNMISNVNNIFNSLSHIANQFVEGKRLDVEVQVLQNQLAEIISRHYKEMEIIQQVFYERQSIFKKLFQVIDYCIENKNDAMLLETMRFINNLAMKNPIAIIERGGNKERTIKFDDDEPLQLNF